MPTPSIGTGSSGGASGASPVVTAKIIGKYKGHDIVQLSTGEMLVVEKKGRKGVIAFPYREWYATKKVQNSASLILGTLSGLSVGGYLMAFTVTSVGIVASAALGSALVIAGLGLLLVHCFNDYVDPEVKYKARKNALKECLELVAEEGLTSMAEKRKGICLKYSGDINSRTFEELVETLNSCEQRKIIPKGTAQRCLGENAVELYKQKSQAVAQNRDDITAAHSLQVFFQTVEHQFEENYARQYNEWNIGADYANVSSDVIKAIRVAHSEKS